MDGTRVPAGLAGGVEVALADRPRRVEVRWAGGLDVEPPVASLEPGQTDRGVRVLDFAAVTGGFRLTLEGPSGTSATVRLHGERPSPRRGATLRSRGRVTEATVGIPGVRPALRAGRRRLDRPPTAC